MIRQCWYADLEVDEDALGGLWAKESVVLVVSIEYKWLSIMLQ